MNCKTLVNHLNCMIAILAIILFIPCARGNEIDKSLEFIQKNILNIDLPIDEADPNFYRGLLFQSLYDPLDCAHVNTLKHEISITVNLSTMQKIFQEYGIILLRPLKGNALVIACGNKPSSLCFYASTDSNYRDQHIHENEDTIDPNMHMNPTIIGLWGSEKLTAFIETQKIKYQNIVCEGAGVDVSIEGLQKFRRIMTKGGRLHGCGESAIRFYPQSNEAQTNGFVYTRGMNALPVLEYQVFLDVNEYEKLKNFASSLEQTSNDSNIDFCVQNLAKLYREEYLSSLNTYYELAGFKLQLDWTKKCPIFVCDAI